MRKERKLKMDKIEKERVRRERRKKRGRKRERPATSFCERGKRERRGRKKGERAGLGPRVLGTRFDSGRDSC